MLNAKVTDVNAKYEKDCVFSADLGNMEGKYRDDLAYSVAQKREVLAVKIQHDLERRWL